MTYAPKKSSHPYPLRERGQTTMREPQVGEFHWQDGWFFSRREDGAVVIRHNDETPIVIPPHEWCSIIGHVAADGRVLDSSTAYTLAEGLHCPTPRHRWDLLIALCRADGLAPEYISQIESWRDAAIASSTKAAGAAE